jgi:hypothetical protein
MHHGTHHSSVQGSTTEAMTPTSVDESAPWLTNTPHSAGWSTQGSGSTAIGASSDIGGSGSGGFDSLSMSSSGFDSSLTGYDHSLSDSGGVEYWLWGDESYGTGASSSIGGSGSGGFDSTSSLRDDTGMTEQYVVLGPLSEIESGDLFLVETPLESPLTLAELPEGMTLLTPIYDDMADASSFSSDSGYEVSKYSPLGSDEDLAT